MSVDLTSGSAIAVGAAITAISSLVGQWLTIQKVSAEASSRREDARMLLIQTQSEAELVKVKMESAAKILEQKVEQNSREVASGVEYARLEARELKVMVKENTTVTEAGATDARKAYHEANQVNAWREDIQKEIRDLAAAVKALLENRADGADVKPAPSQVARIEKTVVETRDKVDQVKEILTADDAPPQMSKPDRRTS